MMDTTTETATIYDGGHNTTKGTTTGQPDNSSPTLLTMLMIIMILIFTGNILYVCVVAKCKAMQTVSTLFTVSLSISDLLLATVIPLYAIINYTNTLVDVHIRRTCCYVCLTGTTISISTSHMNLLAIAIDRYVAVFHGLRYTELMTLKVSTRMVSFVWLYCGTSNIIFIWTLVSTDITHCSLMKVVPSSVYNGFYLPNIVIIMTATIFLYGKVFWAAHQQAKQISDQLEHITNDNDKKIKDHRIIKMMALVLGCYLI